MKTVLKLLTALAAIAGVVYVIATYGDKIVAWAKSILPTCPTEDDVVCDEADIAEETVEAPVEETVEEVVEEEAPAEEAPVVDESEPVAEETDFEA